MGWGLFSSSEDEYQGDDEHYGHHDDDDYARCAEAAGEVVIGILLFWFCLDGEVAFHAFDEDLVGTGLGLAEGEDDLLA